MFRVLYKVLRGGKYPMREKIPFDQIYMVPHPYLPYVYKKNFLCSTKKASSYPLNADKGYSVGQFYTNNLRIHNGIDGSREVVIPKPDGIFRINCLGASTTGNYIRDENDIVFSYPLELEKILQNKFPEKNIEVNNCGVGGFTSTEILIDFLLNSVDSKPDMIVIYHAYNDLRPSLTDKFQSDYSHAVRNLGESYNLFKWGAKLPFISIAPLNFLFNLLLPQNIRNGLLGVISKGSIDLDADFNGLATYKRNINNLIHVCKGSNIEVVISTFCHYLYPKIENDKTHLKYRMGVLEENRVMQELAREHELSLVDNFNLIPYEDKYFVDSIHFSPSGMREVACNISIPITKHLKNVYS